MDFNEDELVLIDEMINTSSAPPCDAGRAVNLIKFRLENRFPVSENSNDVVTIKFFHTQWFKYIAWHSNKYPEERFTPKDNKLIQLDEWIAQNKYHIKYEIEIKQTLREDTLFGEHISLAGKKHKKFANSIKEKRIKVHGSE